MEDVDHYAEWLGPVEVQEREFLQPDTEHLQMSLDLNASLRLSEKRGSEMAAKPQSKQGHIKADSTDVSEQYKESPRTRRRRIPKRGKGPPSTVVCNHIGWIDVMALI